MIQKTTRLYHNENQKIMLSFENVNGVKKAKIKNKSILFKQ